MIHLGIVGTEFFSEFQYLFLFNCCHGCKKTRWHRMQSRPGQVQFEGCKLITKLRLTKPNMQFNLKKEHSSFVLCIFFYISNFPCLHCIFFLDISLWIIVMIKTYIQQRSEMFNIFIFYLNYFHIWRHKKQTK